MSNARDFASRVPVDGALSNRNRIINGETLFVPLDPANRHYAEVMRQVEAGELTIQEADQV